MKKIINILTVVILLTLTNVSCQKGLENYGESQIDILFPSSDLAIDLNVATNPSIICVVNSNAPLTKVTLFIVKGDAEEQYGKTVTSFFNNKSYSIRETPLYSEDMTGVRVIAQDATGAIKERILVMNVKAMQNAPVITFSVESLTVKEGESAPKLTATVVAQSPLKWVKLSRVVNRVEFQFSDSIKQFNPDKEFLFDINNYINETTIFEPKLTSIKIEAEDIYGKVKIAVLPVTFIETPSPEISFDNAGEISVLENQSVTISGKLTGPVSPLAKAIFTLTSDGSANPLQVEAKTFNANTTSYDFSITIPTMPISHNALKVEITDILGKKTTALKPILVIGTNPTPIIRTPIKDYYGIESASNAKISLAQNIITSAPDNISNVTISTKNLAGATTVLLNENMNVRSYTPTTEVSLTPDLALITITATNTASKSTTVEIPVSVDCYVLKDLLFQERATGVSNANGYTTPAFFSAVQRRVLTLEEAFFCQAYCDFVQRTNGDGSVRFRGLGRTDNSANWTNADYGLAKWTKLNTTNLCVLGTTANSSVVMPALLPADFFLETAAKIKAYPAMKGNGINSTGDSECTYLKNIDTGGVQVCYFQTVPRNGKIQRGIIKYEGKPNGNGTPTNNSTIYKVSIILTTPYAL